MFLIELDDGKIYTGKTNQFDGNKTHGSFRFLDFPQQNQSIEFLRSDGRPYPQAFRQGLLRLVTSDGCVLDPRASLLEAGPCAAGGGKAGSAWVVSTGPEM